MIRAGLIFLAVLQGAAGQTQLFAPRFCYDALPTSTTPRVSLLPPYNEHLMRDVGALTLAYVVVLVAAAVWPEPRLVQVALAANLMFTVPYFVFHATHLDHYPTGSAIGQTIALGFAVVLPAACCGRAWPARGHEPETRCAAFVRACPPRGRDPAGTGPCFYRTASN